MQLSPVQEKFVLHWGEMGTRWGINRTVAQLHALLLIADRPLNADDMVQTLGVARSNISNSIKELLGWGVIHSVPVLGERRDHYASESDVWELFQRILDERKRREVDPTLVLLRECVDEAERSRGESEHTCRKLREMHDMIEQLSRWHTQLRNLPTGAVIKFVKMGSKVWKMLGLVG